MSAEQSGPRVLRQLYSAAASDERQKCANALKPKTGTLYDLNVATH